MTCPKITFKSTLFISIIFIVGFLSCKTSSADYTANDWQKIDLVQEADFHDLEVIDDNIAIAYSYGSGKIIRTDDGGKTWRKIYELDSIYLEQIQFLNPMVGYICGNDNTLLKTMDGGKSWSSIAIQTLDAKAPIYGMHFINDSIGYIAVLQQAQKGYNSVIYKTNNSGVDWEKVNEIPEMILHLDYVDEQIWGTGNNVIIKSISQPNWAYVYKDETKKVGQIRAITSSPDSVVAVSFNGYAIRQTNEEWTSQQITTNRLRTVVAEKGFFLAAGDNNKEQGNLFKSSDDGVFWSKFDLNLSDIHRISESTNKFWAIGKDDQLLLLDK